jgi:hypothetical protein
MRRNAADSNLSPLAVVILNRNLADDTIACVESFRVGLPEGGRIVVVDNASSDDSVRVLRARLAGSVEILENERNLGFAGGVNSALRRILPEGAQSIFIVNNDTIAAPDLLPRLMQTAERVPAAGILGPVIYYHADPDRIWRFGDQEHPWLPLTYPLSARHLVRHEREPFQVSYVTGCGMLVRSSVFEEIGLFDEAYFMYFEDADFCRRARQAGFQVWVDPRGALWHKISLSSRDEKPQMRYYQSWGRAHFYRTSTLRAWRWFSPFYLLAHACRVNFSDAINRDWRFFKSTWLGTIEGLIGRPSRISS